MAPRNNGLLQEITNKNIFIDGDEESSMESIKRLRVVSDKSAVLSEKDAKILRKHRRAENKEITAMVKYTTNITEFYERIDMRERPKIEKRFFEQKVLLSDWIIGVHSHLKLHDDTLYVAFSIIDRIFGKMRISKNKMYLLGTTALLIAAKYEEVDCPEISTFIMASDQGFVREDIVKSEMFILNALEYNFEYANPLFFIRKCSKANDYEETSRNMGKYFLELMFLHIEFYGYTTKIMAATAMYLARNICGADQNKNLFFYYANTNKGEIKDCFNDLIHLINREPEFIEIETKYSKKKFMRVNELAREFAKKNLN